MPRKLLFAALLGAATVSAATWVAVTEPRDSIGAGKSTSVGAPGSDATRVTETPQQRAVSRALPAARQKPEQGLRRERQSDVSRAITAQAETQSEAEATTDADSDETLYLTIVGDKTYLARGSVDDGPPSLADLETSRLTQTGVVYGAYSGAAATDASANPAAQSAGRVANLSSVTRTRSTAGSRAPIDASTGVGGGATTGSNSVSGSEAQSGSTAESGNNTGGSNSPPNGFPTWVDDREWPKPACPWTLPPGSGQSNADTLQSQYGCRYLSSCSFATKECSYHYQGA